MEKWVEYFTKLFHTHNYQIIDTAEDSLSNEQITSTGMQEALHLTKNRKSLVEGEIYNKLLKCGGVGLCEKLSTPLSEVFKYKRFPRCGRQCGRLQRAIDYI